MLIFSLIFLQDMLYMDIMGLYIVSSKETLFDSGMQKYGQWNSTAVLTYLLGL